MLYPFIGPLHRFSHKYDMTSSATRLDRFMQWKNNNTSIYKYTYAKIDQFENIKTLPSSLSEHLDEFTTITGRCNINLSKSIGRLFEDLYTELLLLDAELKRIGSLIVPLFELPKIIGTINSNGNLEYFVKDDYYTGYYKSVDDIRYKFDTLLHNIIEAYY